MTGYRSDVPSDPTRGSAPAADASGSIVSGERVLSALYTATDLRQARALSDDDLRSALAVVHAAGELIAEHVGHALRPRAAALAELPIDAATSAALSGRTGATARQVDRGLELLLASQVLLRVPGRAAVRLSRECLVDIPSGVSVATLGRIREALAVRRAAVMPALAVLRYLCDLPADAHGWVLSSLQQAAARAFFKRSTVARALVDLESVGAIERAHGPGLRGHYRIVQRDGDHASEGGAPNRPRDDDLSEVGDHDPGALLADRQPTGLGVTTVPPMVDGEVALRARAEPYVAEGTPDAHVAQVDSNELATTAPQFATSAILDVAGVTFPIPAGAALQPEFDDEGRLWYRLGSARIGPITM